jgi:hypothetical protein
MTEMSRRHQLGPQPELRVPVARPPKEKKD